MTAEDLHLAVGALVSACKAVAIPTRLELREPISDDQLVWFLRTSAFVREVKDVDGKIWSVS